MSFDAYYEWLGIPPDEQPPDFYRLLGVRRFEPNHSVIATAAERQMLLLKTRQNGPHSELTQRLMNEVSSARICLLDTQRRADYDAKLHQRGANETLFSGPASDAIPLALDGLPVLDQPWSEDDLQGAPLPRLLSTTASKAPYKRGSGEFGRLVERPSIRVSWPVVFGGLATTGVSMIALGWLFWGHARPPQSPGPVIQQNKPDESASGLTQMSGTNGGPSTTSTDITGVAGQHSGRPGPVPPDVQQRAGLDHSMSGDAHAQDVRQTNFTRGDDVRNNETARSRLDGQDLGASLERNARKQASLNRRSAGKRNAEVGTGPLGSPASAAAGSPPALDLLPTEFDLPAAIAATGPERILLSERLSFIDANWEILLEDYSSPLGKSKFAIGEKSAVEERTRWSVFSLAVADGSPPIDQASAEHAPGKTQFAHIEVDPTGLFLTFSVSASPELIEQFSLCSLVFRNAGRQHCVQLQASARSSPWTLAFDDSKETLTLDELPAADMLSLDRIVLEVVGVDLGGAQAPAASGRRAHLQKELIVTLDSELQCELGIRLSQSDGQFTIVALPRYLVNDRRQQLVPAEIKKDLARARSQLTKNQRDLNEAANNLRALPQEISRLRGVTPRSGEEAAAMQVRLGHLEAMGASSQSKVRRLSEVGPKLASSIEHTERVLTLVNQMSNQATLHYRILAEGETGDLLLLQAASANYDRSMEHMHK